MYPFMIALQMRGYNKNGESYIKQWWPVEAGAHITIQTASEHPFTFLEVDVKELSISDRNEIRSRVNLFYQKRIGHQIPPLTDDGQIVLPDGSVLLLALVEDTLALSNV